MPTRPNRSTNSVPGSDRAPVAGARVVGGVADDEKIDITVRLRPARAKLAVRVHREGPRRATDAALSRTELASAVAASAQDVEAVHAFAASHGLSVGRVSLAERSVHLTGSASAMQTAFGVQLQRAEVGSTTFRQRSGAVQIPAALSDIVTGVFGLDDRVQARPHFRLHSAVAQRAATPAATFNGYVPSDVSKAYDFPKATGVNQCIALIELGGGYRLADIAKYFAALGIKAPKVVAVSVDGAHNGPTGDPSGPDGEVVLDIEIAGGIAPDATIAVYFAPNTDRGFIDAIAMAVHDTQRKPSVISISWGAPENQWTAQSTRAMGELFQEAAALGVPVFAASGDNGATDGTHSLVVDFPAASPAAIGCGGTHLEIAGGKRTLERVWNDGSAGGATGGGFSKNFSAPAFQHRYLPQTGAGRGVPDVSANADPQTGYRIFVDGSWQIIGGTSAVAPLMAGLIARCNEKGKRSIRNLNAQLYGSAPARAARRVARQGNSAGRRRGDVAARRIEQHQSSVAAVPVPNYFTDIIVGDNRAVGKQGYIALPGWDACCGLGVPNGNLLLQSVWGVKSVSGKQLSS